jgi:hypothetical protein
MSTATFKPVKIDRTSKKLQEYEAAFKRGFDKLTPEQKILVKKPTITDPDLLKDLKKTESLPHKIKSFFGLT